MAVSELARQHGFSPASFYAWRAKYGGMEAEDAKRLKGLESENNRLRRLLAGAHLDIEALKVGFEIGRASCRERVCQYGSITVVAVSLKKKKWPPSNTKTM